jgi:hypothetical protein
VGLAVGGDSEIVAPGRHFGLGESIQNCPEDKVKRRALVCSWRRFSRTAVAQSGGSSTKELVFQRRLLRIEVACISPRAISVEGMTVFGPDGLDGGKDLIRWGDAVTVRRNSHSWLILTKTKEKPCPHIGAPMKIYRPMRGAHQDDRSLASTPASTVRTSRANFSTPCLVIHVIVLFPLNAAETPSQLVLLNSRSQRPEP